MGLLLLLLMVGAWPLLCGLLGSVVQRLQGHFREAWEVWGTKLGRFLKPVCCMHHLNVSVLCPHQWNKGGGMAGNRDPAQGHPHPTGREPVLACPLCQGLVAWGSLGFPRGRSHTSTSHAEIGVSTALRALQAGLHEGEKGLGLTRLGYAQKAS